MARCYLGDLRLSVWTGDYKEGDWQQFFFSGDAPGLTEYEAGSYTIDVCDRTNGMYYYHKDSDNYGQAGVACYLNLRIPNNEPVTKIVTVHVIMDTSMWTWTAVPSIVWSNNITWLDGTTPAIQDKMLYCFSFQRLPDNTILGGVSYALPKLTP